MMATTTTLMRQMLEEYHYLYKTNGKESILKLNQKPQTEINWQLTWNGVLK